MVKKPQKKLFAFFEVLQNGITLCSERQPLGGRTWITLGGGPLSSLRIPQYPFTSTVVVARKARKKITIKVDGSWSGFAVVDGKLLRFDGKLSPEDIVLGPQDYASLYKNDLRILIKIGPLSVPKVTPVNRAYMAPLTKLIVETPYEARAMAAAIVAAVIFLGGLAMGLKTRHVAPPQTLKELDADYSLAFIEPKHLATLPEAMHGNLDRKIPIAQSIDFYTAFSQMMLGMPIDHENWLFPSSVSLAERRSQKLQEAGEKVGRLQDKITEQIKPQWSQGILAIPMIIGDAAPTTMVRLKSHIDVLHDSLAETLDLRRETIKQFRADSDYEFGRYKNLGGSATNNASEKLSKIKVFNELTDEEAMYHEAETLAARAEAEQVLIRSKRSAYAPLTENALSVIRIQSPNSTMTFHALDHHRALEKKLSMLRASHFGPEQQQKKAPQEPLLGEIDPKLIEKTIAKNRFELQLCYELALRRNQNLGGTMKWQWRLDTRGQISDITLINSTIQDPQMRNCVRSKITKWKFPRPRRGSVEVTYPFHFKPARS